MNLLQLVQVWRLKERNNYRQLYDQDLVNNIAESILRQGFNIEYPIAVYADGSHFVIVDGNTRYKACIQVSKIVHSMHFGVWIIVKPAPDLQDKG